MSNINVLYDDDEPVRFPKRRPSTRSKSITKSKHKHTYAPCLFIDYGGHVYKGGYCTQCGKIWNIEWPHNDETGKMMSSDELLAAYPSLPVHRIGDIWEKYVVINKEERA